MRKRLWTSLLLWIWLAMSCGQTTAPAAGAQFTVDVLDWRKGLPQSVVLTVAQTRDGYLWVGTLEGLARFDGLRFTTFDEGNTPGLNRRPAIVKLFEDSRTNLWIGTESAGVFLAAHGQVTRVPLGQGPPEGRLASISEDSSGVVWLYTAEGRLARYRNGNVDHWDVRPLTAAPMPVSAGPENICRAMVVDSLGYLWVGTDWLLFGLQTAAEAKPGGASLGNQAPRAQAGFSCAQQQRGALAARQSPHSEISWHCAGARPGLLSGAPPTPSPPRVKIAKETSLWEHTETGSTGSTARVATTILPKSCPTSPFWRSWSTRKGASGWAPTAGG